eukprot:TRINITY_DN32178_c0_g3_i1.p1 TRINITY_DN32178_c0_g3~~TRINITY_DN32178_c0_g3_i1.p1  ORF type:complete len:369 (+),score=162.64 TRINITY_DN32178_c0_g3_i1:159-1265(+)
MQAGMNGMNLNMANMYGMQMGMPVGMPMTVPQVMPGLMGSGLMGVPMAGMPMAQVAPMSAQMPAMMGGMGVGSGLGDAQTLLTLQAMQMQQQQSEIQQLHAKMQALEQQQGGTHVGVRAEKKDKKEREQPKQPLGKVKQGPVVEDITAKEKADAKEQPKKAKKKAAIFAEERPCEHNMWDNVRSKAGVITLRCRECQKQFKGHPSLLISCKDFQEGMSCTRADCPQLHVFKHKETLAERSKRFGDCVIKPDLPKRKKGRDTSTTPPRSTDDADCDMVVNASKVTALDDLTLGSAVTGTEAGSFTSASSGESPSSQAHAASCATPDEAVPLQSEVRLTRLPSADHDDGLLELIGSLQQHLNAPSSDSKQ